MEHNSVLQKNIDLLLDYLRNHYHTNLAEMLQTESMDLIKDCFREFSVFLVDIAPVDIWWGRFLDYAEGIMTWMLRPEWHVAWCVRSFEFADYVQTLDLPIHQTK